MRDVNQVIEFRAAADDRMADRCIGRSCKSADLDFISIITFRLAEFLKNSRLLREHIQAIETDHPLPAPMTTFFPITVRHKIIAPG